MEKGKGECSACGRSTHFPEEISSWFRCVECGSSYCGRCFTGVHPPCASQAVIHKINDLFEYRVCIECYGEIEKIQKNED